MADIDNQRSDRENSKPSATSIARDDDVKSKSLGSQQKIAQTGKNLGGLDAGTEKPVTAPVSAGE
jgi:hypothetical protein